MFYLFSIDATQVNCLCKFVNDSEEKYANCGMRKIDFEGPPRIYLIATAKLKVLSNSTNKENLNYF